MHSKVKNYALIFCLFVFLFVTIGGGLHMNPGGAFLAAVAVCLAPLTLFRTDASVRWGITKYKQISYFGEKLSSFWGMFFIACVVALAGVLIRVTSMLLWAIRSPLDTLRSVPQNWLRQSFCTDLFYPVEFV